MRFTLIAIWVVAMILFCWLSYTYCCGHGALAGGDSSSSTVIAADTVQKDKEGDNNPIKAASLFTIGTADWSVECPTATFLRSSAEMIEDQAQYKECFDKITAYQKQHPDKQWTIIGRYADGETNNTIYKNLGEARASKIKTLLTNYGVPAAALTLQGQKIEQEGTAHDQDPFFQNDTLFYGYAVSIVDADPVSAPKEASDAPKFDNTKPIVLRFNTGSDIPLMNATSRQRFGKLIKEMERLPDRKLIVTGHTDNIGDPNKNMKLGLERADFIKIYLTKNGIDKDRVEIESKGQTDPISEDNALNRRVEVKFKN